jgi:cytochrome c oxidase subunit 2
MVALVAVTATGCASEILPHSGCPPRDVTDHAPRILSLWQGSWIAALAVGALVWGLIIWSVIFHRRRHGETGLPPQTRYNVPIEVLYTVVPLIAIAVFFFFTVRDQNEILEVSSSPDHQITVTGIQWSWQFNYTSDGGSAATSTGTPGKPPDAGAAAGRVGAVHPALGRRHPLVLGARLPVQARRHPGNRNSFEITPKKIGTYDGKCAELCGQDHSRMLFNVEVVSRRGLRQLRPRPGSWGLEVTLTTPRPQLGRPPAAGIPTPARRGTISRQLAGPAPTTRCSATST